MDSSV